VVHFIELWGQSSNNLIAFTEPEFPYLESLAPYQPLSMKVSYTPIDTSLNFVQANKLVKEIITPRFTVLPLQYTQPPTHFPHRTDLMIDLSSSSVENNSSTSSSSSTRVTPQVMPYKTCSDSIKLPIKDSYARVILDSGLSSSLIPMTVKPGVTIATVTASLQGRDNNFSLKPIESMSLPSPTAWSPSHGRVMPPPSNYSWGSLDLQLFMQALTQAGLYDSRLEHTPTGTVIHLVSHSILDATSNNCIYAIFFLFISRQHNACV
jgi:integrator complex subunit 9